MKENKEQTAGKSFDEDFLKGLKIKNDEEAEGPAFTLPAEKLIKRSDLTMSND